MKNETIVLEKSTNTHLTKSEGVEVVNELDEMTTVVLKTNNQCIVEHGHHATVSTEKDTKHVIKITQQEYNPVTKKLINAFD